MTKQEHQTTILFFFFFFFFFYPKSLRKAHNYAPARHNNPHPSSGS
jgi:hypothetical protein